MLIWALNTNSITIVGGTHQSKDREYGEVRKDGVARPKGPHVIAKGLVAVTKEGNRRFWTFGQIWQSLTHRMESIQFIHHVCGKTDLEWRWQMNYYWNTDFL